MTKLKDNLDNVYDRERMYKALPQHRRNDCQIIPDVTNKPKFYPQEVNTVTAGITCLIP